MEDQIDIAFLDIMDEAMSIMQAEEVVVAATVTVNGREHHMGYYLVDGIYPSWLVFIKGVCVPQQEKHRFFSMKQASVMKDVVCDFDLLKKRFNILAIISRSYSQHTLEWSMLSQICCP
jgi:hypothetical protein